VKQADWRTAVFGYTGMIDVTARGEGRVTWQRGVYLGADSSNHAVAM
jgi:2-keto-4-pentenoate hydratase/2-oxohepta-3-ene-1,7-dioic acid hydratase in catechol pathway